MKATDQKPTVKNHPEPFTIKRLLCPDCHSPRLRAYKSRSENDGSVTRYSKCRDCGRCIVIIIESCKDSYQ